MTMTIHADPVPLRVDNHGVIRIADSRLSLDVLLDYYSQGISAEDLADGYQDVVSLADIFAVLAYYHRHRDEVEEYLTQSAEKADALRRQVEAMQPPRPGFREVLLARQSQLTNGHAPPAQ